MVANSPDLSGAFRVDPSRGQRNSRVASEWFSRPDDQRYLSLTALYEAVRRRAEDASERVVDSRALRVEAPRDDAERLSLILPDQVAPVAPTHWSFGQLCGLVGAPAAYLRQLPAPVAAINLQVGLAAHRSEPVKTMATGAGRVELRAVTGPDYGRIWDHDLVGAIPIEEDPMAESEDHQRGEDAEYRKVAIACGEIVAGGKYPSVATVQAYMRGHLGGGIKTVRISGHIRRWEAETKTSRRNGQAAPLEPPRPSLDDVLERHPNLLPAFDALGAELDKAAAAAAQQAIEARGQAVANALDSARQEEAQRHRELRAAHQSELDAKDAIIDSLRNEQAAQIEEMERLQAVGAEQGAEIERLRRDLALAEDGLRQANDQNAVLSARLNTAEERVGAADQRVNDAERGVDRLTGELAAARQSVTVANEARAQAAAFVDAVRADLQAERSRTEALHERIARLNAALAAATGKAGEETGPGDADGSAPPPPARAVGRRPSMPT